MDLLFPEELALPFGFSYKPDFIDDSEERELIDLINTIPLKPMIFQGFQAKRLVAAFGYHYHFDSRTITRAEPIPEIFKWIVIKTAAQLNIPA